MFAPWRWQLLLEERLNTGSLPQEVGVFVELLWAEALGCLDNVLSVPVTDLSLNDVRLCVMRPKRYSHILHLVSLSVCLSVSPSVCWFVIKSVC